MIPTSGGMEFEVAVKIFSSFEEEHGLRYTKSILETVTVKVSVLLKQRCMVMPLLRNMNTSAIFRKEWAEGFTN